MAVPTTDALPVLRKTGLSILRSAAGPVARPAGHWMSLSPARRRLILLAMYPIDTKIKTKSKIKTRHHHCLRPPFPRSHQPRRPQAARRNILATSYSSPAPGPTAQPKGAARRTPSAPRAPWTSPPGGRTSLSTTSFCVSPYARRQTPLQARLQPSAPKTWPCVSGALSAWPPSLDGVTAQPVLLSACLREEALSRTLSSAFGALTASPARLVARASLPLPLSP